MSALTERAFAKLNLTLDVLGRRPDGYHEMKMVMQSVSLYDEVELRLTEGGIAVATDKPFLPTDGGNLAYRAAETFLRALERSDVGVSIRIRKRIPVCAGLAGGSADAAAVFRGLSRLLDTALPPDTLRKAAEAVGSDVPYCLLGGTALATGRGETLETLPPLPDCAFVIVKPTFSVSTPRLFERLDSMNIRQRPDTDGMLEALGNGSVPDVARRCFNIFEGVLPSWERQLVEEAKDRLLTFGAAGASMTGTGSAVYGLFEDPERAGDAHTALREFYPECFLAFPTKPERFLD